MIFAVHIFEKGITFRIYIKSRHFRRGCPNVQPTHKKMLNLTSHQRNTSIPMKYYYSSKWLTFKRKATTNVGEDVEPDKVTKSYNQSRKLFDGIY